MNVTARLALVVFAAAAVWLGAPQPGELRAGLAIFVLVGGLWVTQAPLAVTALLVPLAAVAAGLLPPRQALAPFAHPVIFLFLGGFALAAALAHQGLDRLLAARLVALARGHRLGAVLLLCGAIALLSMWMSNTATVAMMLPLALGLLAAPAAEAVGSRERVVVLLALAYSASIGGMATLVGSPPNAIAAAQAGIGFATWLAYGVPIAALLWPLMLALLYAVLRPRLGGALAVQAEPVGLSRPRVATVVIFAATVAGWIGGNPLGRWLGVTADMDTVVALAAFVALVASGALGWNEIERHTRWGVLVLFGGGIALSEVMGASGASGYLAASVLALAREAHPALLLLAVVAFVVFLTEQHRQRRPAAASAAAGGRQPRAAGGQRSGGGGPGRLLCLHAAGRHAAQRHRVRHRRGAPAADDALRLLAEPAVHRRHHRGSRLGMALTGAVGAARPARAPTPLQVCGSFQLPGPSRAGRCAWDGSCADSERSSRSSVSMRPR